MEWAKDGDGNTLLFHHVVNGRKSRNRIDPLVNEFVENIRDDKNIVEEEFNLDFIQSCGAQERRMDNVKAFGSGCFILSQ